MSTFEERFSEFMRKGDMEKVRWMKSLNKTVLPSQVKRIQQNDKTVLMEMVIPRWVDWNLLYEWAQHKKTEAGEICILCDQASKNGIKYLQKHICESCFLKLKHLQ